MPQLKDFLETYVYPIIQNHQFALYVAAIVIALAVYLILKISHRRNQSIRVFDNQAGHVDVSNRALFELIHSACKQISSVYKPRICFKTSRAKLTISIKFKLEEGVYLSDTSAMLQTKIKDTLREMLNIEKTILVNTMVTGFLSKSKTKTAQNTPAVEQLYERKLTTEPSDKQQPNLQESSQELETKNQEEAVEPEEEKCPPFSVSSKQQQTDASDKEPLDSQANESAETDNIEQEQTKAETYKTD